jgi:hypothetical protein
MEVVVKSPRKKLQPWEEVAIDGDTLEKRRDQRAEQMVRFISRLTPDQRRGVLGVVNQWTPETGVRAVPASESLTYRAPRKDVGDIVREDLGTGGLRDVIAPPHEFDVPKIVKRTPEQRIESRLLGASPETLDPILSDVAGEYWKAGAPTTVAALRAVASHYLNRAERRR